MDRQEGQDAECATMNARQYEAIAAPFRDNPRALRILLGVNSGLKYLCYVLYPVLLILVAYYEPGLLLRELLVPAALFIAVSVFRYLFDEKRPYEAFSFVPLIRKDTKGKSMPSRHIFSVFMIAMAWLRFMPLIGGFLLLAGCVLGVCRVVGGVHYPRDVIVGAVVAIIGGYVGLWIIPLS